MTTETVAASEPGRLIVEACHEPWAEAWSRLAERMSQGVLEALRQGLTGHVEAIESAGLDDAPPSDWAARAVRLVEYRRAVGKALLEPLASVLQTLGPADTIAKTFAEALESANARAQELPRTVTAPWPEGALAAHPADDFMRRLGKALARAVSAARKPGQPRQLPLRGVAVQHLGRDVAEAQGEAIVEAMSAWAAWTGRVERAWVTWADVALPALMSVELSDDEKATEPWTALRDGARELQAALERLVSEVPHAGAAAAATAILGACRGALDADLAVAGSFLLPAKNGTPARLVRVVRLAPAHRAWDGEVAARLQLYVSILAILAGADAVRRRVVERCREGPLSRAGDLLGVASELRALLPGLAGRLSEADLRERIGALEQPVTETLQPIYSAIPDPARVAETIHEVADATVEALLAVIRQAPVSLELHDAEEAPPHGPKKKVDARALPLQELARQSFDALRIERIRSSTSGLVSAINGVRADLEGLPEVFAFARDEAVREMDSDERGSEARAAELIRGGLERMAASLETRVEDLNKAIGRAEGRLAAEMSEGSSALLGRVGAGRMEAQLLAARSRAADVTAWITDRWGPLVKRAASAGQAAWTRIRGALASARRWAAELLGQSGPATAASTLAVQSIAEVQAVVERLPLVYQRLFTLDPVADAALFAGRTEQLEIAMARWRRWHSGEGIPLLVRGRQRSGITSFLRVFGSQIEADGHSYVRVSLDARIADENALARLLSVKLGLPAAENLDRLARAIFEVDEHSLPAAITVDNLEHLYLRVPKGTDLAERFLTLSSETEPRVFWIAGITASAWQLIATAEPTAVSQVDVMDLPPLGAQAIRDAILARHRRSGLDVRYEEAVTRTARIRRRLRHMRDGKGLKKQLEDEFFEQLHRASGGYLGLALFLWLQSARFDDEEGVVMALPTRPDFSVLEQLSLTQNFTLKAFLEHRTLTLDEHDRVFRLPRQESYQIFESLHNRNLIEEVARDRDADPEQSEIEGDLRYRVRPLLTGAVIAHLQARNIVH